MGWKGPGGLQVWRLGSETKVQLNVLEGQDARRVVNADIPTAKQGNCQLYFE